MNYYQFSLITVPESDLYIFRESPGEERLRTATDISATISKLHRNDYVRRAGLLGTSQGTDQRGDLR